MIQIESLNYLYSTASSLNNYPKAFPGGSRSVLSGVKLISTTLSAMVSGVGLPTRGEWDYN